MIFNLIYKFADKRNGKTEYSTGPKPSPADPVAGRVGPQRAACARTTHLAKRTFALKLIHIGPGHCWHYSLIDSLKSLGFHSFTKFQPRRRWSIGSASPILRPPYSRALIKRVESITDLPEPWCSRKIAWENGVRPVDDGVVYGVRYDDVTPFTTTHKSRICTTKLESFTDLWRSWNKNHKDMQLSGILLPRRCGGFGGVVTRPWGWCAMHWTVQP
jgi:hypothetical protein